MKYILIAWGLMSMLSGTEFHSKESCESFYWQVAEKRLGKGYISIKNVRTSLENDFMCIKRSPDDGH